MRRSRASFLVGTALILSIPVWAESQPEQKSAPMPILKDAFGDPLPPGAVARIGTVRYRLPENLRFQPQMSPDGKLLAVPAPTGQIELWELPAWSKSNSKIVPKKVWRSIAFTPDSKQIVALDSQQRFHLIDLATGKADHISPATPKKQGPERPFSRLFVSNDKQIVVRQFTTGAKKAATHKVVVWDLAKNEVREALTLPLDRTAAGNELAISSDGRRAAQWTFSTDPTKRTKGEPGVEIWNLMTGKSEGKFKTGARMNHLVFAPDGRTLAGVAAQPAVLRIFESATGKEIHDIGLRQSVATKAAYSPDGKELFIADEIGVTRIDPANGKMTGEFKAPIPIGPSQLAFPPDGKVLALASVNQAIHFWEATTGKLFSPNGVPAAAIADVGFNPQNELFVACENGSASWWNPRAGSKLRDFKPNAKDPPPGDAYTPGSTVFSLSPSAEFVFTNGGRNFANRFELFEAKSGKRLFSDESKENALSARFFDADRKVAIMSGKTVRIRDPRGGKELDRFDLPLRQKETVLQIVLSPSGKHVAAFATDDVGDFDRTFLWEADKKKITREWPITADIASMQFTADGHWLGLSDFIGNVRLVDMMRGGRDRILIVPGLNAEEGVMELAFSPDGRQIACAVGLPYEGPGNSKRELGRIVVFESASKKIRLEMHGHATGIVRRLAFSRDGSLLASGASDTTVLVWRAGLRAFADKPAARDAKADELNDWFAKLAGSDAKAAYLAMIRFAQTPTQAVKLFESRIEPAPKPDPGVRPIPLLIQDLGSSAFPVRSKAHQILQKLGSTVEPELRAALPGTDLETRRRIESLLDLIINHEANDDELRHVRAAEVLQAIGSPDARALLTRWAAGDPSAILTVEARKTLAMMR